MKGEARFFRLMGTMTIILAVFSFLQIIPYMNKLPEGLGLQIFLSAIVWIGIGLTQIAFAFHIGSSKDRA